MILNSPYISGSLTVTGNTTIQGQLTVTGSLSGTASLASNALLLQGTGSTGFATTASVLQVSSSQQEISSSLLQVSASYTALSGSYNTFSGSASTRITVDSASLLQVSSSQQQISSSQQQISSSYIALSGSYNTFSGSASTRTTQIENVYATTGSNSFRANQSITGSLVVSSTIMAQTLIVQTVTSSIVYSSGSNIFGCDFNSRQTFTGSVFITGSSIIANVGAACFSGTATIGSDIVLSAANPVVYGGTALGGVSLSNNTGGSYIKIFGASHATTPNATAFINANSTVLTISACGNLLIGKTTSAGGRLQVSNGTVTFNVDHNADGPYLTGATDNNVSYRKLSYDASEHIFLISATAKMRITSGGVVSINQTCGYGIFNVTGIDCAWGEGIVMNPAPNGYSAINFRAEGKTGSCYTDTWQIGKASSAESAAGELFSLNKQGLTGGLAGRSDASQQWKTNGDSIFGFKVGIGTCTPSRPLTVYPCTNGGSMSTGCTFLENAYFGNGGLTIGQESGTLNIALMTNSNKDIIFGGWNGTTNAERMRITSGGSVGINTNSPTSNTGLTAKRPTGTGWIIDALNGSNVRMGGIYSTGGNNGQLYLGNSAGTETILLDSAGTSFFNGGNLLIGTTTTCKGLLRVAGNAEICKTLFFNGGDGNGGAIANALAVEACATPVYNLRTTFCFNNMSNYGAYLFIHTGYNTVTTKNSTITGIVNNGANQTISILATTVDSGATAPSVHSTSNWCIAFCWPNPANSNTQFIMLAG